MARPRNVDKNTMTLFFQFECFRVGRELNRSNFFSVSCVENCDAATAKAHINSLGRGIVTHVIGVIFEIDFTEQLKILAVIDIAHPTAIVRDKQTSGNISNALGRSEAADGMNACALTQIDHLNSVIAERANKQSLSHKIEVEMIDPPFDSRQRKPLLQLQWRSIVFARRESSLTNQ